MTSDPLAPLLDLPGVAEASETAREALAQLHRHKINLRNWKLTSSEAALRSAQASSVLDGGPTQVDETSTTDPIFAGALRVAQAMEGGSTQIVNVWKRAPLQALARLHVLAAADRVDDEDDLGRPQGGERTGRRLEMIAQMATGATRVPAPVFAAVVHGELLTLAPFGSADGVVARAASRLVTVATGLDLHGLGVPEVIWMRRAGEYRSAAAGFTEGTAEGMATWLTMCCRVLSDGAIEATKIADAAGYR